jgi:hypothetical protein
VLNIVRKKIDTVDRQTWLPTVFGAPIPTDVGSLHVLLAYLLLLALVVADILAIEGVPLLLAYQLFVR